MKVCRTCGIEKPAEEFFRNRSMPDGRLNHCKPCVIKRHAKYLSTPEGKLAKKREREKNADKYRAWKRKWKKTAKGIASIRRYKAPKYLRDALNAIKYAVRTGKLIRQPCAMCGEKAQAHHSSYAKDMLLAVTWLCRDHHVEVHRDFLKNQGFTYLLRK